jgi:RimJ/RimL family protein N-acetyltransferase
VEVRPLERRERAEVQRFLGARPRENLLLLDLVDQLGRAPSPGEARAEVLVARRGSEVAGVVSLRPVLCAACGLEPEVVEGVLPWCDSLGSALLKCDSAAASLLWAGLRTRGRRTLLDRLETAQCLSRPPPLPPPPRGAVLRAALARDLPALVHAARASLREEGRPDPYEDDPEGFRRWVRGRLPRALVGEVAGEVAFVAYADVRRPEGWLVQGVYTWPARRERGLARAGVAALCARAFAEGGDHVQLAVVEGNRAAQRLYAGLGFRAFATLRTVLFT